MREHNLAVLDNKSESAAQHFNWTTELSTKRKRTLKRASRSRVELR
jgi:hypothetical protein